MNRLFHHLGHICPVRIFEPSQDILVHIAKASSESMEVDIGSGQTLDIQIH